MMNLRLAGALTAMSISATAVAGCGAAARPRPAPAVVLTASQVAALRAYGTSDTAFGLSVLASLCASRPAADTVISPVSLATGLAMAYLGARGPTAASIARVLHWPAASGSPVAGLRARSALLRSLDAPAVTFTASNEIWADPSLTTSRSFAAAVDSAFQAGLRRVPLLTEPERARQRINAAIAADTRGHIPSLLPTGSLSRAATGWVLTDALYLSARWKDPFNHALTVAGSFATPAGPVTARYLNGDGFASAQESGWTAAALPYRGGRLSMLAVLPPAGGGGGCQLPAARTLHALATGLGSNNTATSKTATAIALPKVRLASSESLREVLTALGMGLAFSGRADFTGLSPQACCIGLIQHAATLAVAERGTVATAATAVGVQASAARITLTFDRPYLLVLQDSLTGEPLMLAWVANPAAS